MTDIPTPRQQLITENDELRARLGEAEETLRAIRNSEVDALVLAGLEGDYIHALEGGLEPYRVMVESMNEGAFTLAVDGTILYCNSRFAERVKQPLGQIVGTPLTELLADQDRERLETMLTQAAKEESRGALTLQAADGTQTPTLFSMSPLPQSDGQVISVVTADLSAVIAAAEARARLALIVESSDDAIVSTTLDGIVESWNRAAEQLYGYAAGEAIGQSIESLTIPPGLTDEVTHELEAIRRGKRTLLTDTVRRRKDGSPVDVSIKASPTLDDAGKVVGASINARDITERKKSEERLKLFRTLLDHSSDAIEVLEPSTFRILDVNEAECRELGYSREELLAMTIFNIDPALTPERAEAANTGMRKEEGTTSEGVHRRRDGSTFPVEVHSTLVELDKPYVLSIARDITERKAAELALQINQKQLSEALKIAKIGYWEYEFSTNEFIFNDQYYTLHKITAEEAGGYRMSATDFASRYVHPEDAPDVGNNVRLAFESRDPDYFAMSEARLLSGEGEIVWVEVRFRVEKDLQGNTIRLKGVNQDITERKQAEEVLRHFTRALKTLSAVNRTLVHAPDEQQLWQGVCRAAVEDGKYLLAWVGYAQQDEAKSVKVMASHAVKPGYSEDIHVSWDDVPAGHGPTGMAIRSGKSQYIQDIAKDPAMQPWREKALSYGYKACIALPLLENGQAFGALTIYASEPDAFNVEEIALLEEMAEDLSFGIHMHRIGIERDRFRTEQEQSIKQIKEGLVETVEAIASMVEMRDPYTAGHQRRVAELAVAIAGKLGMDEGPIQGIFLAGIVHDLGKITIPAEILSYPGRLSEVQMSLIKGHSQSGFDILKDISFPWPIAQMVLQHHERLDGSGYPQGLTGEEMLREAKILSVADVVEAMASHRPYRPGLGLDAALEEINDKRGTQFDAEVVDACTGLHRPVPR